MNANAILRLGTLALRVLYPPHCAVCRRATLTDEDLRARGAPLDMPQQLLAGVQAEGERGRAVAAAAAPNSEELRLLCGVCAGNRRRAAPDPARGGGCCPQCSRMLAGAAGGVGWIRCAECCERNPAFECAVAVYFARGSVREVIHQFKYQGALHLRRLLALWLAEGLADPRLRAPPVDVVVPVPLHWSRRLQRGFNQAEVLARELCGSGAAWGAGWGASGMGGGVPGAEGGSMPCGGGSLQGARGRLLGAGGSLFAAGLPLRLDGRRAPSGSTAQEGTGGPAPGGDRPPPVELLLQRGRSTGTQTRLDRRQRAENLRGAFRVGAREGGRVRGARVLLVDDVYTTGSTLDACARALLLAGAASVRALAVARG